MLELQLKKPRGGGSTAATGGLTSSAPVTTATNGGLVHQTSLESRLDGYFTDSSTSGIGTHHPLITVSHPNGKRG